MTTSDNGKQPPRRAEGDTARPPPNNRKHVARGGLFPESSGATRRPMRGHPTSRSSMALSLEEPFGVDRCLTPHPCGRDRLPVGEVDHVTGCENTLDAGPCG